MSRSSKPKEISSFRTKSWRKSSTSYQLSTLQFMSSLPSSRGINLWSVSIKKEKKKMKSTTGQKYQSFRILTKSSSTSYLILWSHSNCSNFACLFATDITFPQRQEDIWFLSDSNTRQIVPQTIQSIQFSWPPAASGRLKLKKASWLLLPSTQFTKMWMLIFWRSRWPKRKKIIKNLLAYTSFKGLFLKVYIKKLCLWSIPKNLWKFFQTSMTLRLTNRSTTKKW